MNQKPQKTPQHQQHILRIKNTQRHHLQQHQLHRLNKQNLETKTQYKTQKSIKRLKI